MHLYLSLVTLMATTFVHLSCSEMRTLYFGAVPPPAPGKKFDKGHWLESAMPKRENQCPGRGAEEIHCATFEASGYQFHYKLKPLPKSPDGKAFVNFSVRTESNAIISLVGQNMDLPDMYEIVIGGWGDTKSVIRERKLAYNHASVDNPSGWLDGQTYKHFWVSATPGTSQNGTDTMAISVGRGSDENPIMEYIDHSPLPVNYLGFSMWDNVGSYKFCGLHLKH